MMMKKMKRQESCLMAKKTLPEEIISNDILSRLPAKSIFRFKSVSKTWCSLFSDPFFIKLHRNHALQQDIFSLILNDFKNNRLYSIDSDSLASQKPLHIIDYPFISLRSDTFIPLASSNGLICFAHYPEDGYEQIYLWNPSTDECSLIPPPSLPIPESFLHLVDYGLGYDFKLNVYKIFIVIMCDNHGSTFTRVELYTLGSDSWKVINHQIPHKISSLMDSPLVNGALHWMTTPVIEGPNKASYNAILSFDGANERFKEVSIPKTLNSNNLAPSISIGVLSESLCIFDDNCNDRTDVWVMKEYGVSESWTKLFTILKCNIDMDSSMTPINSFRNGYILLQIDAINIVLYDRQKGTTIPKLNDVGDVGKVGDVFEVMYCVSSIVSLNSKTYLKQELGETPLRFS